MTMPLGSTEEPDVIETEYESIPVHVVSSDAKPGKSIGTEFGRWRTFLISSAVGQNSITPGAQRLLNRSLRRHRAHIIVNASVVPSGSLPTAATAAISAAGAGAAALPAGATLTSTVLTFPTATTAAGTVTITNTVSGPLVFNVPIGVTFFSIPGTYAPNTPGNAVTVTVAGAASAGGGSLVISGTTLATGAQSPFDGILVGGREEIISGQIATPGLLGGYLQIGDNVRWESQQELWVCYPSTNTAPVLVSVCDEVYASDPEAWREDQ